LEPLKLLHQRLFPLDYDDEFFTRSVHGLDGIVGFGALVAQCSARISVGPDLLPHLHQEHAGQGSDNAELLAGFITGTFRIRRRPRKLCSAYGRSSTFGQSINVEAATFVLLQHAPSLHSLPTPVTSSCWAWPALQPTAAPTACCTC
jgi:hypothetical protein